MVSTKPTSQKKIPLPQKRYLFLYKKCNISYKKPIFAVGLCDFVQVKHLFI